MIKVDGLYKSFAGQMVLEDIHFEISDGELIVILGASGTGKSVLLQHMAGLMKPDRGTIRMDDVDITCLPEHALLKIRRHMGYLFQDGALYDFMTVEENVAFPLREHTKLATREIIAKVHRMLTMVGLDEAGEKLPAQLSGGMRKRAALARAIIMDSRVVLCDEPTSGLDPVRSREISDLIRKVTREVGCTMVVTSHDMNNAFRIADRLIFMQEGRIVTSGTPEELKTRQDGVLAEFLS